MTWQYTIEWHPSTREAVQVDDDKPSGLVHTSKRKNIVTVTSKPRSQMESSLITVNTWTSYVAKNMTENPPSTANLTGLPDIETYDPITVFAQVETLFFRVKFKLLLIFLDMFKRYCEEVFLL